MLLHEDLHEIYTTPLDEPRGLLRLPMGNQTSILLKLHIVVRAQARHLNYGHVRIEILKTMSPSTPYVPMVRGNPPLHSISLPEALVNVTPFFWSAGSLI